MHRAKRLDPGDPQLRLGPRRRARRLALRDLHHQHGEVAGQIDDLAGAVEGGEMQVQGLVLVAGPPP